MGAGDGVFVGAKVFESMGEEVIQETKGVLAIKRVVEGIEGAWVVGVGVEKGRVFFWWGEGDRARGEAIVGKAFPVIGIEGPASTCGREVRFDEDAEMSALVFVEACHERPFALWPGVMVEELGRGEELRRGVDGEFDMALGSPFAEAAFEEIVVGIGKFEGFERERQVGFEELAGGLREMGLVGNEDDGLGA